MKWPARGFCETERSKVSLAEFLSKASKNIYRPDPEISQASFSICQPIFVED